MSEKKCRRKGWLKMALRISAARCIIMRFPTMWEEGKEFMTHRVHPDKGAGTQEGPI